MLSHLIVEFARDAMTLCLLGIYQLLHELGAGGIRPLMTLDFGLQGFIYVGELGGPLFHALFQFVMRLTEVLFCPFTVSNVNEHVHCADELSRGIPKRHRMWQDTDLTSARPFDN